jgi:hypothetical protein
LKLLLSKITIIFGGEINTTARATPGQKVVLIFSLKIITILGIKSFKVASCHVGTQKISPGRCDLDLGDSEYLEYVRRPVFVLVAESTPKQESFSIMRPKNRNGHPIS